MSSFCLQLLHLLLHESYKGLAPVLVSVGGLFLADFHLGYGATCVSLSAVCSDVRRLDYWLWKSFIWIPGKRTSRDGPVVGIIP